jgi:hypothetical protein
MEYAKLLRVHTHNPAMGVHGLQRHAVCHVIFRGRSRLNGRRLWIGSGRLARGQDAGYVPREMSIMRGKFPLMRVCLNLLGAAAIVLVFFFGTIFVLDYNDRRVRDRTRAEHADLLKGALEKYHKAHGTYPLLSDNAVDDLKGFLVDPGYLRVIPSDPLRPVTGYQYRYVSNGQQLYGILFKTELGTESAKFGKQCITGVNTAGSGIWAQPPDCPF